MREFSDEAKIRRHHKMVEVLRTEIYEILRREVKDPRVHDLTLTAVELSPDLRSSTIYVCKFAVGDGHEPTTEEQVELMSGLKSASHFVYEALKKRLRMKIIPSIRFEYDNRISLSSEVWRKIHGTTSAV